MHRKKEFEEYKREKEELDKINEIVNGVYQLPKAQKAILKVLLNTNTEMHPSELLTKVKDEIDYALLIDKAKLSIHLDCLIELKLIESFRKSDNTKHIRLRVGLKKEDEKD